MRVKGSTDLTLKEVAQAKQFAALGYSTRRIARELGRNPRTIKRLLTMPTVAAEVSTKKIELADLYENRAYQIVEAVTTEDISDASLQQKAVSSGIFLDKARLIRGESTVNIQSVQVLLDVCDLLRQLDDEGDPAPRQVPRTLSAVQPDPASPVPSEPVSHAPSRPTQTQPTEPAPVVRVKYYTPTPVENEEPYNPLTHGMPHR